jgi:hypothetical protein
MSEPEDCIKSLDEWIKTKKTGVYDENIKGPNNDQLVLQSYTDALENLGEKLILAIEREDTETLIDLQWPDDLMNCIKDLNIRTVIVDRIECWFIRYPFIRSKMHLEEMSRENAGVN